MTRPRLLVDTAVLDRSAGALPLAWLDGFELLPYAPRQLGPATPGLDRADAALVRSMTRVDAALLDAAPQLRAVATLSSGTDHLDVEALQAARVALHTGRGGNALAVADWVAWALRALHDGRGRLDGRQVLVVGVGAVGTAVAQRLEALGARVLPCDPPRAQAEPGFVSVDLDAALAAGGLDAVTLHVPLTSTGAHPTRRLLDADRLGRLDGAWLLNAARGGVLDEAAAIAARRAGRLGGLALDTFVGEPRPDPGVVAACDRVTPHVAGHSVEGKLRVARLAVAGLRAHLGLPPPGELDEAVQQALAGLEPDTDLDAERCLDAAAAALRRLAATHSPFDDLRHGHKRLESRAP